MTAQVGEAHTLLDVDMHTVQFDELFGWTREIELPESANAPVGAMVGWFDVRFCPAGPVPDSAQKTSATGDSKGAGGNGVGNCVELTTAPDAPPTHWAHTTLLLRPEYSGGPLTLHLTQSKASHHDLNLTLTYGAPKLRRPVVTSYAITADFRGERSDLESDVDFAGDEEE